MSECFMLDALLPAGHVLFDELLTRHLALGELLANLIALLVELVALFMHDVRQLTRIVPLFVCLDYLKHFLQLVTLSVIVSDKLVVLLHRFGQNLKLLCLFLSQRVRLLSYTVTFSTELMHINLIENEIPQVLLILGHFLKLRHIRRVPFFVSCQIDKHLLARWVMQQILYLAVHNPIHIAQIDFFIH